MTTLPAPVDGLHATARWTAAVRAGERARPDALVDDPWAEALAGADGMAWLEERETGAVLPIVIRTRYFDDWLRTDAIAAGMRQAVLLAAGLDTRAYRLPWPQATRLFELDHAAVLDAKAAVLDAAGATPAADVRRVPGDLSGDVARRLVAAGLDPSEPAVFLAEGVLFYLPVATIGHVLDEVTEVAAPGSRLGFDVVNEAVLRSPYTKAWIEMQAAAGAPWIGWMNRPVDELAARGWTATVVQPGEPVANHGRWTLPVIPAAVADLPHSWYVTGTRT